MRGEGGASGSLALDQLPVFPKETCRWYAFHLAGGLDQDALTASFDFGDLAAQSKGLRNFDFSCCGNLENSVLLVAIHAWSRKCRHEKRAGFRCRLAFGLLNAIQAECTRGELSRRLLKSQLVVVCVGFHRSIEDLEHPSGTSETFHGDGFTEARLPDLIIDAGGLSLLWIATHFGFQEGRLRCGIDDGVRPVAVRLADLSKSLAQCVGIACARGDGKCHVEDGLGLIDQNHAMDRDPFALEHGFGRMFPIGDVGDDGLVEGRTR